MPFNEHICVAQIRSDDPSMVTHVTSRLELVMSEPVDALPPQHTSSKAFVKSHLQTGWQHAKYPKPKLQHEIPSYSSDFVRNNFMFLAEGGNSSHMLETSAFLMMEHPAARHELVHRLKTGKITNWKLSGRLVGMMGAHLMKDEEELNDEITSHLLDLFAEDTLPLPMAREQALIALLQPGCYAHMPTIKKLQAMSSGAGEPGSYETLALHVMHGMLRHHIHCNSDKRELLLKEANDFIRSTEEQLLQAVQEGQWDNANMFLVALLNSGFACHASSIAQTLEYSPPPPILP